MQGLSKVPAAKGKFVERKYLAMLTAPLDSSGTLVYTAPGRLEKNTLAPKPERLVLDQDKLTHRISGPRPAPDSRAAELSGRVGLRREHPFDARGRSTRR